MTTMQTTPITETSLVMFIEVTWLDDVVLDEDVTPFVAPLPGVTEVERRVLKWGLDTVYSGKT